MKSRLALVIVLAACTPENRERRADAAPAAPDAADALAPDAAPPSPDAAPRPDAAPPPDAAAAPTPEVLPLPGDCPAWALPPLAESHGEEVCNYGDDDGDGRVDEGFAYASVRPPVPLAWARDRTVHDRVVVVATDRGFLVTWVDGAVWLVALDAAGCPLGPARRLSGGPGEARPRSLVAAATADRALVSYTLSPTFDGIEEWPSWSTHVHLLDAEGRDVRPSFELEPARADVGVNAAAAAGTDLALFSLVRTGEDAYDGSFAVLAPDGGFRRPPGPLAGEGAGRHIVPIDGMNWDGEAFTAAGVGAVARWDAHGRLALPRTELGDERWLGGEGLHWTGRHHVLVSTREAPASTPFLAVVDRDGLLPEDGLVAVAPRGQAYALAWTGNQLVVLGWFEARDLRRLSPTGVPLDAPSYAPPRPVAIAGRAGGPLPLVGRTVADGDDVYDVLYFTLWGCGPDSR